MYKITDLARPLGDIDYQPGAWRGQRIGIFRRDGDAEVQIGEYERNHPSLYRTFAHFRAGDRDLALYAPDYTSTRLMELPSCRDLGGEEHATHGFCPVDYYVPTYIDLEFRSGDGPARRIRKQTPAPEDLVPRTVTVTYPAGEDRPERTEEHHEAPVGPLTYHPFGFVAGCIWGDDSSWKVQYLDLSRAGEGILRREERFGYLELPPDVTLDRAIDLDGYRGDAPEDWANEVRITILRRFDLRNGQPIDPFA